MKQAGVEWCEALDKATEPLRPSCSFEAKWMAISPGNNRNFKICEQHKKYYEELDNRQPKPGYQFTLIEDTVTPPSGQ